MKTKYNLAPLNKTFLFWMVTSMVLMLLSWDGNGQIKIGTITVDNETAKEYFFHLQTDPDTVELLFSDEGPSKNKFHRSPIVYTAKQKKFNDSIDARLKSGKGIAFVSNASSMRMVDQQKYEENQAHNEHIIENNVGEIKDVWGWTWYLMIRKPSEEDFAKWYATK